VRRHQEWDGSWSQGIEIAGTTERIPIRLKRRDEMNKEAVSTMVKQANELTGKLRSGKGTGGKFLTFFLAGEEYGIEILKVHEIIGMMPITRVPRTPQFIRGVINLRGKVIPIVDLRLKFGMESVEQTAETCIIVVHVEGIEMGIVVDRVSEVLNIAGGEIEDAPSFGEDVNTDYILGIGKTQAKVKILLDIDRVLSTQDVVQLHSATVETEEVSTPA
jgi:purine-binding chemotaxis protein CheW